jgi:hypothetical protein
MVQAPGTASGGIWREAWIGRVCGNQMGQMVSFYPSKAGVMFSMVLPNAPTPEHETRPAYHPPRTAAESPPEDAGSQ